MCMLVIRLIMDEKNSNDKEKKKNLFILLSLQSEQLGRFRPFAEGSR